MEEEKNGVDKSGWVEQQGSCLWGAESNMEEYEGSDDCGGGGAKEGLEGDDLAYKSVDRDPYLRGMKRKIETDLECEERSDMRCRQNVDDQRRGLALADGLQWWPL